MRLAVSRDLDLAPFFFALEAGWADAPKPIELVSGTTIEGQERLLAGEVDAALVSPVAYAHNTSKLLIVPTPALASDIASDSIFLLSKKRPDQLEQPKVAASPASDMGASLMSILSRPYYGFQASVHPVESETAALDALNKDFDMCIVSGEVGMRAAGPAAGKGMFVEELTKAWWVLTGLPVPIGMFAVRSAWVKQNADANTVVKQVMQTLRGSLLKAKEQMDTLCDLEEKRTGIEAKPLAEHYARQHYELNESHLRGLLEFYRRGAVANILSEPSDLQFFPSLAPAPAPAPPPRRSQPEKPKPTGKARDRGSAQGLRVIKGGKDE